MRRQDGQIIPALVMVMLSLLALGMLFFQVGRAAIFSTEAQTAADAAALAAAKHPGAATGMVFRSGISDSALSMTARCARRPSITRHERRPRAGAKRRTCVWVSQEILVTRRR
jgi:hypothetical protein